MASAYKRASKRASASKEVTIESERQRALQQIEDIYDKEPYSTYPDPDLANTLKELDIKFVSDLYNSLQKADDYAGEQKREEHAICPHGERCYRQNREHRSEYHQSELFKVDVQNFLTNSKAIFVKNRANPINESAPMFSLVWLLNIGQKGNETEDLKCQFNQNLQINYESFYFILLANIVENINEYMDQYGADFLIQLLQTFDETSCTGFFETPVGSFYAQKLKECRTQRTGERDDHFIISNTAIQDCIKNIREGIIPSRREERSAQTSRRLSAAAHGNKPYSRRPPRKGGRKSKRSKRSSNKKRSSSKRRSNKKRSNKKRK